MSRTTAVHNEVAVTRKRSFMAQEEEYQALLDTAELVPEDQQEEYKLQTAQELAATTAARDKRGGLLLWLRRCRDAAKAVKSAEWDRLNALEKYFEGWLRRMEAPAIYLIQSSERDDEGEYKKLYGMTHILSLHKLRASTVIDDIEKVPSIYKTLTIKIPAVEWEAHIELCKQYAAIGPTLNTDTLLTVLQKVEKTEVAPDKEAIKGAIEANIDVPGAHLKTDSVILSVR